MATLNRSWRTNFSLVGPEGEDGECAVSERIKAELSSRLSKKTWAPVIQTPVTCTTTLAEGKTLPC